MADWVTLSPDRIYSRMAADEVYALTNIQLQPGERIVTSQGQELVTSTGQSFNLSAPVADLLQDVIDETAQEVRASIMAGGYAVDTDPLIPKILEGYALAVIPFKLWSRLGGNMLDLEGSRRLLYDRAIEVFKKVENGKFDAIPVQEGTDDTTQTEGLAIGSSTRLAL